MSKLVTVLPNSPETLPPKDGTWVKAYRHSDRHYIALQYDVKLKRWYTGKGHAVAEANIFQWIDETILTPTDAVA